MTSEQKRLRLLETEMDMAIGHIAALRAALIGLTYELQELMPMLPARLAVTMMDLDAPAIRAAGGTRAEQNAIETEFLAEQIQAFAV